MKSQPTRNQLCLSCRRGCKQAAAAIVSVCPRYYPLPRIKKENLRQMELDLFSDKKSRHGKQ